MMDAIWSTATRCGRALAPAVLAVVVLGCRPDCAPRAGTPAPNVVLVTIDTLRADHLGCYGNSTVRTPALDRLAAEGTVFERCWAQAPITVPSHLSILSSLPLAAHGVMRNDGPAPPPVDTLPGLFRRAGYRTAAFVSAKHLGPAGVLGPILTDLETYRAPHRVDRTAEETNAEVVHWLRGACRDPFFAWVHYYDPHMPYAPPAPYDSAYYHDDPFDARHTSMAGVTLNWFFHDLSDFRRHLARHATAVRALKHDLGASSRRVRELVLYPEGVEAYARTPDERTRLGRQVADLAAAVRPGVPLRHPIASWLTGVRDLRFPLARYAAEVAYVDHAVGALRAELERLGIAQRTIVVVTADHGESLGEHGIYFDHFGLHEPNLRVPLIVWGPGRVAPARRTDPARGLDVAPTVLALAALPVPTAMQGRDLLAGRAGDESPVLAEAARGVQHMALQGRWKLIRTERSFHYVDAFARDAGTVELYDLAADPEERQDLVTSRPEVALALGRDLDALVAAAARPAATGAAPVAPDLARALRALGYVE